MAWCLVTGAPLTHLVHSSFISVSVGTVIQVHFSKKKEEKIRIRFAAIIGSYFERILLFYLFNNALSNLDYLARNFGLQHFVYLSQAIEFIVRQNLLSITL
jgi:hypothetical protein